MSLRKEQCKKVCRILDNVLSNRPTERDSLIVAVQLAFEAQPEPHWIPVEQALPEELTHVLLTAYDGERMGVGFINTSGKWCYENEGAVIKGYEPIAWMPLPEPYKGVTE